MLRTKGLEALLDQVGEPAVLFTSTGAILSSSKNSKWGENDTMDRRRAQQVAGLGSSIFANYSSLATNGCIDALAPSSLKPGGSDSQLSLGWVRVDLSEGALLLSRIPRPTNTPSSSRRTNESNSGDFLLAIIARDGTATGLMHRKVCRTRNTATHLKADAIRDFLQQQLEKLSV